MSSRSYSKRARTVPDYLLLNDGYDEEELAREQGRVRAIANATDDEVDNAVEVSEAQISSEIDETFTCSHNQSSTNLLEIQAQDNIEDISSLHPSESASQPLQESSTVGRGATSWILAAF